MAFILDDNSDVVSFAEMQDVLDRDQRLFDSNEGLSDTIVESLLIRATERILTQIRSSSWWKDSNGGSTPVVDANSIVGRQNDFTDLCVYVALAEYILPTVADFGDEDNAERNKMSYYQSKSDSLFIELVNDGYWYDFDGDGNLTSADKKTGFINLRRVR